MSWALQLNSPSQVLTQTEVFRHGEIHLVLHPNLSKAPMSLPAETQTRNRKTLAVHSHYQTVLLKYAFVLGLWRRWEFCSSVKKWQWVNCYKVDLRVSKCAWFSSRQRIKHYETPDGQYWQEQASGTSLSQWLIQVGWLSLWILEFSRF